MNRMPTRNLPPSAEPWGRAVDTELATISRANQKQAQDTGNALSAINGTLTRLGEQVAEIRSIADTLVVQQATLEAQQAELEEQQDTLTAQQAQLTQTVADLQSVVSNMLRPFSGSDQIYGFTVTGDATVVTTTNLTVPSGYTRALVFAVVSTSAANQNASVAYLYNTIRVDGAVIGSAFDQAKQSEWVQVTAHGARVVSGLTSGQQLSITGEVYTSPSQTWINTGNFSKLSAQVLFLR